MNIMEGLKMLDLLIKDGRYADFETGEFIKGNMGINHGKIVSIGDEEAKAKKVIDASGKIVSPGFIDIHMHEEKFKKEGESYRISEFMLKMGVTTAVGGNCGLQYQDLKEFKEVIKRKGGSPINYVMLAGYNEFRYQLGIERYAEATKEQRKVLRKLVKRELDEGAFGVSFGIEYDPGISYEEMKDVLEVLEDERMLGAAHYRNDCIDDIESVKEMIKLSEEITPKFQISHLSSCSAMGWMKESLEEINLAIEKNPKLNYDTYPYNAFSTLLGSAVFDDGCLDNWKKEYSDILLTQEPYKNVYCTEEIFKEAREKFPDMLAVAFVMNEEEITNAINNKCGMIASDGIVHEGKGHPRAAGTFPRVLGKYVRDDKVLKLIDALRKMTLEPAKRLSLKDKGQIRVGADADITIFNPETIADGPNFENIDIPNKGIDYVIVNGSLSCVKNEIVSDNSGEFIDFNKAVAYNK